LEQSIEEDKNSKNIGNGQKGIQSALQNSTHLEMLKLVGKDVSSR